MKKFLMAMVFLMTMMLAFSSCGSSETDKIEAKLVEKVTEDSWGLIKKCKTLQLDIDTIRVADIKAFIADAFPKELFPNGIPSDFSDKDFSKFIAPMDKNANDDDIAYLAVTYKSKRIPSVDLFKRAEIIVTEHWLIDPSTYDYVMDDFREDGSWTAPQEYLIKKETQSAYESMLDDF